jgi:hypothetical protein
MAKHSNSMALYIVAPQTRMTFSLLLPSTYLHCCRYPGRDVLLKGGYCQVSNQGQPQVTYLATADLQKICQPVDA